MIDTHVHVACSDRERWPRRGSGVGSSWHDVGGTPEAVLGEARRAGVDRLVVVQAVGVYGEDVSCAASVVAADPQRLALVGAVTIPGAHRGAAIHSLAAGEVRLAGVRLFALGGPADVFDGSAGDEVIDACRAVGAVPVLTVFPEQLASVVRLAARFPSVTLVIDHCGFPERGPGLDAVCGVANISLKVTTHVLDHQPAPEEWLAGLRDRVGAARLCWGSDHPQHPGTYQDKLSVLAAATARWSSVDREMLVEGTASRLFFPGS